MISIRIAQASDIPELATLYQETVRAIAPRFYSDAQTQSWASFAEDRVRFREFILSGTTFLAVDETGILGFAGIADDGHILSVYVRRDRIRQGIGSRLMEAVFEYAKNHQIQRLYAEASEFSLGLFKRFRFQVYDRETVECQGVEFQRYLVDCK